MTDKSKIVDEPTETLPSGHPEAGYVSPDLSFVDGGALVSPEKEWAEERDAAQQAEAKAVAQHEDQVAKAEANESPAPDPRKADSGKS